MHTHTKYNWFTAQDDVLNWFKINENPDNEVNEKEEIKTQTRCKLNKVDLIKYLFKTYPICILSKSCTNKRAPLFTYSHFAMRFCGFVINTNSSKKHRALALNPIKWRAKSERRKEWEKTHRIHHHHQHVDKTDKSTSNRIVYSNWVIEKHNGRWKIHMQIVLFDEVEPQRMQKQWQQHRR